LKLKAEEVKIDAGGGGGGGGGVGGDGVLIDC